MRNPGHHPIKIVIADGQPVFREGLRIVLKNIIKDDIHIVAEAENGKDLVCMVEQHKPHIVITDVKLPVMGGIEATQNIIANHPDVRVIALTASEDCYLIYKMLQVGVKGYLTKNMRVDEIAKAVKAVMLNQSYFSDSASKLLLALVSEALNTGKKNNIILFSDKEIEMIKLICKQLCIKEIAGSLKSSIRNIEDYSRKIKEKTGAKNLVGIALFAIKNNIVQISEI